MDRKKEFDVRNFVKQQRLGSLGNPRDLSLGGTKNKKVYVPNLNAVRTKNKTKEIVNKLNQERLKRESREKFKGKRDSSRFVQSSGVFAEGASNTINRNVYKDSGYGHDNSPAIAVPKLIKVDWDVNKKAEKKVIDTLLNCEDDSSDSGSDYEPIILPLMKKDIDQNNLHLKAEQIKLKHEHDRKCNGMNANIKVKSEDFASTFSNHTIFNNSKMFSDDHLSFCLLKMPDSFPGKGFEEDSDELVDYTVKHMHEGQIGKIQIRQSGKIEVYVGNTFYILDAEDTPPFIEDIMIMPDQNEAYTDPLMGRVAPITDRYVLSPSWKSLFLNSKINRGKKN